MKIHAVIKSPLGKIFIQSNTCSITGIRFFGQAHFPDNDELGLRRDEFPLLKTAQSQLDMYFVCRLKEFTLPFLFNRTDFQTRVWHALRNIPYGKLVSYSELAVQIGEPGAARAAGAAVGRNPISIVVPCHRVIGSNGRLTGYAGGLDRKTALLNIEKGL